MRRLLDPANDAKIREALRNADRQGKLGVVAAVTGISGGEELLRKILNGSTSLSLMQRGTLASHLVGP